MVGGKVIEVCSVKDRPDVLFVDCADKPRGRSKADTCAIYVERTPSAEKIEIGDSLWWQGRTAYWTPACNNISSEESAKRGNKGGRDYDIPIPRVGYSGVKHPSREVSTEV